MSSEPILVQDPKDESWVAICMETKTISHWEVSVARATQALRDGYVFRGVWETMQDRYPCISEAIAAAQRGIDSTPEPPAKSEPAWEPPCTCTRDGRRIVEWRQYPTNETVVAIADDGRWGRATKRYYREGNLPGCLVDRLPPKGKTLWKADEVMSPFPAEIPSCSVERNPYAEDPSEPKPTHVWIELPYTWDAGRYLGEGEERTMYRLMCEAQRAALQAFKLRPMAYGAADNSWPVCCGEPCEVDYAERVVIVRCRHE